MARVERNSGVFSPFFLNSNVVFCLSLCIIICIFQQRIYSTTCSTIIPEGLLDNQEPNKTKFSSSSTDNVKINEGKELEEKEKKKENARNNFSVEERLKILSFSGGSNEIDGKSLLQEKQITQGKEKKKKGESNLVSLSPSIASEQGTDYLLVSFPEKSAFILSTFGVRKKEVEKKNKEEKEDNNSGNEGKKKKKIACVGAGNWGTTVARLISTNVPLLDDWESEVILQIYDEPVDIRQERNEKENEKQEEKKTKMMLSEVINTKHENIKYLPSIELPNNLRAEPDMQKAIQDADLIVFGVPDQFVRSVARLMKGKMKEGVRIVTLTKGVEFENNRLKPVSQVLSESLDISTESVCVLSGANLAVEVAQEKFSEATLACKRKSDILDIKPLFNRPTFRVSGVTNVEGPQMCGALKNVIALGKGMLDGLNKSRQIEIGMNTEAAYLRISLNEIIQLINLFFDVPESIYFESCCMADLLATCAGGRHRKTAEQFALHNGKVSFEELEREVLNGQKLQGTYVVRQIFSILTNLGYTDRFPIMSAVYRTVYENAKPEIIYHAMTVQTEE